MKKLLIILFLGFTAFGQTFEVVNKGYYYGVVGDTVLTNRTTDLKALTDVQEYLEINNLELGEVVRPRLEVKRKSTTTKPPEVIRDTVWLNNGDISIGNQWMGEPIRMPIYGTIIHDAMGGHSRYPIKNAFDNDINTFSLSHSQSSGWIGQDYGNEVSVNRFRFLPAQIVADAMKMNGALIQSSNNGTNWTTIHTISGITETNFNNWVDISFEPVKDRMFRIYATQNGSYCRVTELEFYSNNE